MNLVCPGCGAQWYRPLVLVEPHKIPRHHISKDSTRKFCHWSNDYQPGYTPGTPSTDKKRKR